MEFSDYLTLIHLKAFIASKLQRAKLILLALTILVNGLLLPAENLANFSYGSGNLKLVIILVLI